MPRDKSRISYQNFWRVVTNDGKNPCALAYRGGIVCGGPKDAHHYFPKRRINGKLGRYSEAARLALTDVRNGVCLCRHHHDAVEALMLESPRPTQLSFFLLDHGLTDHVNSLEEPA